MKNYEAKAIYEKEMGRLAMKVADRLGIEPTERGEIPAIPIQLLTAEATVEALKREQVGVGVL